MHIIYILVTYNVTFSCTYQPVQWLTQDLVLCQYFYTVYSQNIESIAGWLTVIMSKIGDNLYIRFVIINRNKKKQPH